MNKSRTTNTIYNFITSIGGQFLTIILQFVVRTVFISTLGKAYLGISGLFSNILQMLSLAELGVGSAILFKLYDPLAKKDKKRVTLLLKFYKKIYRIIGIVIIIIGICLIPFLKYIVGDYDKLSALGINATLIYILYLLKTTVSYFFLAYKSAIVKADQHEYILNLVSYIVTIISSIAQIIILLVFKDFILYLIALIITVLVQNYLNALVAKKMYPYINDSYDEKIGKEEIIEVFKDCSALLIYRINSVVLKATDNIIISMFLGLDYVGLYSNYYIIYTTIDNLLGKIFESVLHSIGNLHTTNNKEHEYRVFKTINLIAVILGATAGIGIACISNEFIKVWIGKKWIIIQPFSILMGIEIFGLSIRQFLSKYRSAMGLFQQAKYRPIFGMVINLIVSLLLVKKIGINGVLIGTIIADWTTIMWYDPYIIYKYGLSKKFSVKEYYVKNIKYTAIACMLGFALFQVFKNFSSNIGWLSIIVKTCIVILIIPIAYIGIYRKKEETVEIRKIYKKITKRS